MAEHRDVCDMRMLSHGDVPISGSQVRKISAGQGLMGASANSHVIGFLMVGLSFSGISDGTRD